MGIMKKISILCEEEDREGLIKYINMPKLFNFKCNLLLKVVKVKM